MNKRERKKMYQWIVTAIFLVLAVIGGLFYKEVSPIEEKSDSQSESVFSEEKDLLKIYYFDVGQADSILVQKSGKNMLIDAGDNKHTNIVVENLQALGVERLDYVIRNPSS